MDDLAVNVYVYTGGGNTFGGVFHWYCTLFFLWSSRRGSLICMYTHNTVILSTSPYLLFIHFYMWLSYLSFIFIEKGLKLDGNNSGSHLSSKITKNLFYLSVFFLFVCCFFLAKPSI